MSKLDANDSPGYREAVLSGLRKLLKESPGITLVTQEKEPRRIKIDTIERDGEPLYVFPDGDRHERRIQRALSTKRDRVFWTNLTVACGSPGKAERTAADESGNLAKRFASLPAARQDVDAFYEYYQPMRIGEPIVLMPGRWSALSPGYYASTIPLDNPSTNELFASFVELRKWVLANRDNPEYLSYQINFCFSGHGVVSTSGAGPGIQLADRAASAAEVAVNLYPSVPDDVPAPVRLDLYLDCCHSAAFAQALTNNLQYLQRAKGKSEEPSIEIGQIYCACLDDEEAFEFPELQHGVFSFAFLNECSRKRPEGSISANLGLRDVGWYTGGKQHPLLLDFTSGEGMMLKFPSQYYLSYPPRPDLEPADRSRPDFDTVQMNFDPVGEALRIARVFRSRCLAAEIAVYQDSRLRKDFSRDELLTNKRFPFL